jgi:hypothetical protein
LAALEQLNVLKKQYCLLKPTELSYSTIWMPPIRLHEAVVRVELCWA